MFTISIPYVIVFVLFALAWSIGKIIQLINSTDEPTMFNLYELVMFIFMLVCTATYLGGL